MKKSPNYFDLYQINVSTKRADGCPLILDKLKDKELSTNHPLYVFDIDHTLLETETLKINMQSKLEQLCPDITQSIWSETYAQAKTSENYYDYQFHLKLLIKIINTTKELSISELDNYITDEIQDVIPSIVHQNMIEVIKESVTDGNLVLVTAGEGEFTRKKTAALINCLPILPTAIVYVQQTYKGPALIWLLEELNIPQTQNVIIYDDNPDELADIKKALPNRLMNLIRVKQPNGKYNNKPDIE